MIVIRHHAGKLQREAALLALGLASPGVALEGALDRRAEIRGGHAGVLAGSERRGAQLGDAGPHRLDHLAGHTRPHRHNVDRPLEGVEIAGAAVGQRHDDGVCRFGVRVDRNAFHPARSMPNRSSTASW